MQNEIDKAKSGLDVAKDVIEKLKVKLTAKQEVANAEKNSETVLQSVKDSSERSIEVLKTPKVFENDQKAIEYATDENIRDIEDLMDVLGKVFK